ncbi:unnamed protein product, partial [marine sediment metagenome]
MGANYALGQYLNEGDCDKTIDEKIEQNIKFKDGYFDPIDLGRIKIYTRAGGILANDAMQTEINILAKQLGIKNTVTAVIDENISGQALGFDHELSTPTVIFDTDHSDKFTIMRELAHIKLDHVAELNPE